jgi:hypothetical protein
MMKTSTCALHVTDWEVGRQTSTCGFQLTFLASFWRGLPFGPEGRTELRGKMDESIDPTPLLGLLVLLFGLRGSGGIFRNHATGSMLSSLVGSSKRGKGFKSLGPTSRPGPEVQ